MIPKEILDELNSKAETEVASLDVDLIKSKLGGHLSSKLCEMIVSDRYLGFGEKISVMCMEELARRRNSGDAFDFEGHIEEISKGLPDLGQISAAGGMDLRAIIGNAMRTK
jgi:hypothetical protein